MNGDANAPNEKRNVRSTEKQSQEEEEDHHFFASCNRTIHTIVATRLTAKAHPATIIKRNTFPIVLQQQTMIKKEYWKFLF